MSRLYDPIEIIINELRSHGVTNWDIDRRSNHPKILFVFNGNPIMFVVPGSPSDSRGWRNSLSDLRKCMGVSRVIVKSTSRKRKRNPTAATETLADLTFSVRPNPLLALSVVADRLNDEVENASQAGRAAFLGGMSGSAPIGWANHLSQSLTFSARDRRVQPAEG